MINQLSLGDSNEKNYYIISCTKGIYPISMITFTLNLLIIIVLIVLMIVLRAKRNILRTLHHISKHQWQSIGKLVAIYISLELDVIFFSIMLKRSLYVVFLNQFLWHNNNKSIIYFRKAFILHFYNIHTRLLMLYVIQ